MVGVTAPGRGRMVRQVRVLVAGGTGALGVPVARVLQRAGHEVVGTSRRPGVRARQDAEWRTVGMDLLDPTSVDQVMAAVKPDAVVHAATALPTGGPRRWSMVSATNALRDRGTGVLVAAARTHGVRRLVAQSFVGGYPRVEDPAVRLGEDAPFGQPAGSHGQRQVNAALRALEEQTLSGHVDGVVLRFGFFYGDPATTEALQAALRRRRLPLPGGAPGVVSFVHVRDAARAVLLALEAGPAGATFNVADPEPRPFGDYLRDMAARIGAPSPLSVPVPVARLVAPAVVEFVCRHRPMDTTRARTGLGWSPGGAGADV